MSQAPAATGAVTVRKVENAADFRAFFALPWSIYQDDPNWVPPLLSIRRETLDPKKNPAWSYLEGDYYVAWRGDVPVGTIAAFVNKRHNEFHDEHIAWFGFFDVYDDAEAARALLETAITWGRERGYDAVRGPQSFTTHEECGLLVEGFGQPVLLMPYNAPYYAGHIEAAGFTPVMDSHSFYYDYAPERFAQSREHQRLHKLVERVMRKGDVSVRSVEMRRKKEDFALVKAIYNDAWEKNWGFVPMTDAELDALVESLAMIFDPRLSAIVYVENDPVGFMLGAPDFNAVLKHAYPRPGEPELFTLLKAAWHWKLQPKIEGFRIPLMGVKEAHRKRGLDLVMYKHVMDNLREMPRPYRHVDGGWVLAINQDMMGTLKGAGMAVYRTYRYYEYALK